MEGLDFQGPSAASACEGLKHMQEEAGRAGLEVAPLKVGWYNQALEDKSYQLDYPDETFAFGIISAPSFFEKTFAKHLETCLDNSKGSDPESPKDYFDDCVRNTVDENLLGELKKSGIEVRVLYDFDMDQETFKPHMLAQVVAHSAGMARCYRQNDLNEEGYVSYKELNGGKDVDRSKIYPVCLHPKYGGWFGIRALVVFPGLTLCDGSVVSRKQPHEILTSQQQIAKLLYLYNNCWADWTYRDVGMPSSKSGETRYSEPQKQYFAQMPDQRTEDFLRKILSSLKSEHCHAI